jgi:hypothetical protein
MQTFIRTGQYLFCRESLASQEIAQGKQGIHRYDGLGHDLHRLTTFFIQHPPRNHELISIRQ